MKVFGFTGRSGSGKTTLIENLIPIFTGRGLTVSLIKHTHHEFDVDQPGKDSFRQRQAGAMEVLLTSDMRWVLMHELRGAPEPELPEQLARLSPCDLVLVEGFKRQPIPKLEVWRPNMRFVPVNTPEQQALLALHCARSGRVKARTAQADQIRGLLGEFGTVLSQGLARLRSALPEILEDGDNALPGLMRTLVNTLLAQGTH